MRKRWFIQMLIVVCPVLLVNLLISVKAETAGMAVTAVREMDLPEPSSGSPEEEPGDGNPEEEPDGNPDGEPCDTSDDHPDGNLDDTPNGEPDGEPDGTLNNNPDGIPDDTPNGNPDAQPDGMSNNNPDEQPDNVPNGNPDGEPDVTPGNIPNGESDGESDDMSDNNDGDGANEEPDGYIEDEPWNEDEPDGEPETEQEGYPHQGVIHKMIFVVAVLAGSGILGAVTGFWGYLWLLMIWYLFKKRRCRWHGILTEEENRFIEICPADDDYCLAQEIIDYSPEPTEALRMLEETGDVTYLPGNCRVRVSFRMDGEYRTEKVKCDESRLYEFMESFGGVGEKRVLIENRAARIQILLVYP